MSTFSVTPQASPLGSKLVEVASLDNTVCQNVTGGAGTLFMVEIDNEANVGDPVYVKLFDDASAVLATTDPDWILKADAGKKITYVMPEPPAFTALSAAAVKEKANSGTTSPDSAVKVRFLTS